MDTSEAAVPVQLHVGCPTPETAEAIAAVLITAHLATAAHITATTAIYRWNGTVHQHPEHNLTLLTTANQVEAISTIITSLHPYDLPTITVTSLNTNPDVTAWITAGLTAPVDGNDPDEASDQSNGSEG